MKCKKQDLTAFLPPFHTENANQLNSAKMLDRKLFYYCAILIPFLLISCGTSRNYWSDWSDWSKWKDSNKIEYFYVDINSQPNGAKVYIDNNYKGVTPLKVKLWAPVLKTERKRDYMEEYNPGMPESIIGGIIKIATLNIINPDKSNKPKTINSEYQEMTKCDPKKYKIIFKKTGFAPKEYTFKIPEKSSIFIYLSPKKRIAVTPLDVRSIERTKEGGILTRLWDYLTKPEWTIESDEYQDIGIDLAITIEYLLNKDESFHVISRMDLDKVLKEQELGLTGIIDEKTAVKIGRILGVEYLTVGSAAIDGEYINVTISLVNTESGVKQCTRTNSFSLKSYSSDKFQCLRSICDGISRCIN